MKWNHFAITVTKFALIWLLFVTVTNAIESPQLKVQPFIGLHLHIAPENRDIRLVDGMAGTNIAMWRNWKGGFGATSYSWGIVIGRRPLLIVPIEGYLHFGHVWANDKKPWAFGGGVLMEW